MADSVNKKETEGLKSENRSSIEQIREILFGEKAAEWERRMNMVIEGIRLLDEKMIDLEKRLAELGLQQDAHKERYQQSDAAWTQLHDLVKLMDKDIHLKIDHLKKNKADRELIAQAFSEWALRMKQADAE